MSSAPSFIYGTAWKEDRTETLVEQALNAGFTAIDTANQRKHYFEEAVGKGIQKFLSTSDKKRSNLFIQTKFTYTSGQDHRLPYEKTASFTTQVEQSLKSSFEHLQTDYLDSYVLHGPYYREGIGNEDMEVWKAMETAYDQKLVKSLGVSNVTAQQLHDLYNEAKVKPQFVQNRCFATSGWDYPVRLLCRENQIHYQGFSLLTANSREIMASTVPSIAKHYGKTIPQIIFKFSQQIGMIPLTGTSDAAHMKLDLDITNFELTPNEIKVIEKIAF